MVTSFGSSSTLLFIDDVHPESQEATGIVPVEISTWWLSADITEKCREVIEYTNRNSFVTLDREKTLVEPSYIVLESEVQEYTMMVIDILSWLSRKKRYNFREGIGGFCSNQKLLDAYENPTCIGYDLGLTYFKDKVLGYASGVNILSDVYHDQQDGVTRVYRKVNPDFTLEQSYYS